MFKECLAEEQNLLYFFGLFLHSNKYNFSIINQFLLIQFYKLLAKGWLQLRRRQVTEKYVGELR